MTRELYQHPDGHRIRYSDLTRTLECFDQADARIVETPIGAGGLIDLGLALVALGFELRNAVEVPHE